MEMIKRVYAKPTILKVQLSHEQAVLAPCSVSGTDMRDLILNTCKTGSCRQDRATGGLGRDFAASS